MHVLDRAFVIYIVCVVTFFFRGHAGSCDYRGQINMAPPYTGIENPVVLRWSRDMKVRTYIVSEWHVTAMRPRLVSTVDLFVRSVVFESIHIALE